MRQTALLVLVVFTVLHPSAPVGVQAAAPQELGTAGRAPGSSFGLPLPPRDEGSFVLVDHMTVNGSDNGDDDGYGILFDDLSGKLYVAGTVRETGEGANIWIGHYRIGIVFADGFESGAGEQWSTTTP